MQINSRNNKKLVLLELKNITKKFNGVVALIDINFKVYSGEIVALVGDNGAGKSTLIKVISGVYIPNSGEIYFENKKVQIRNPNDSLNLGIETIYQDLALFDNLTPSGNLFMGREIITKGIGKLFKVLDQGEMNNQTIGVLNKIGISLPEISRNISYLSGGQRQATAIARAVKWGKKLIIMDEPTAALGVRESANLLKIIKNLISIVRGIIIISHNIEHVIDIADRVVVLRQGKMVGEVNINDCDNLDEAHNGIVLMITGKYHY